MPRTFTLTNLGGVAIRLHASAILAFLLLLIALAGVYFPSILPEESSATYWSVGFISALFLFLSTLVHELGHSLVARARGLQVGAITLVMFSGSSDIKRDSERPLDEALISIAGPAASLVIALVAGAARFGIPNQSLPLTGFLELVLILNAWLALFNLLPTLPLDGGQAIRGLLWHRTGNYIEATRLASFVGRGLAGLLFAAGAVLFIVSLDGAQSPIPTLVGYDPRVVALVIIVVAWFLNSGARNVYRRVVMENRFRDVPVSQIMTPDPSTVAPWTSLDEIVTQHFLQRGDRAIAVVREGNVLMGLVAYADVRKIPRSEWPTRAAGEVMTRASELVTIGPEDSVDAAIRHMAERHLNQLPVVADGRLVGMIARVNVLRFMDLKDLSESDRR